MAVNHVVKMKKGDSVTDLFDGDIKKNFECKGNDEKGELTNKGDQCVTIAYTVKNDTVTFNVTKSPKLFTDGDQKTLLKNLFG